MLGFILGIITALLAFIALLVLETYLLATKGKTLLKQAADRLENEFKPKAVIIEPRTDEDDETERKVEENDKQGQPTNINDLY